MVMKWHWFLIEFIFFGLPLGLCCVSKNLLFLFPQTIRFNDLRDNGQCHGRFLHRHIFHIARNNGPNFLLVFRELITYLNRFYAIIFVFN